MALYRMGWSLHRRRRLLGDYGFGQERNCQLRTDWLGCICTYGDSDVGPNPNTDCYSYATVTRSHTDADNRLGGRWQLGTRDTHTLFHPDADKHAYGGTGWGLVVRHRQLGNTTSGVRQRTSSEWQVSGGRRLRWNW